MPVSHVLLQLDIPSATAENCVSHLGATFFRRLHGEGNAAVVLGIVPCSPYLRLRMLAKQSGRNCWLLFAQDNRSIFVLRWRVAAGVGLQVVVHGPAVWVHRFLVMLEHIEVPYRVLHVMRPMCTAFATTPVYATPPPPAGR